MNIVHLGYQNYVMLKEIVFMHGMCPFLIKNNCAHLK